METDWTVTSNNFANHTVTDQRNNWNSAGCTSVTGRTFVNLTATRKMDMVRRIFLAYPYDKMFSRPRLVSISNRSDDTDGSKRFRLPIKGPGKSV